MDEAKTKPAGKKTARKTAPAAPKATSGKPPARARTAAPTEPVLDASPALQAAAEPASPRISPEERHRLIAETAYYRASQRGFRGGAEVEDWLAAEAEVDNKLLGPS
jgi:hypothetical protein